MGCNMQILQSCRQRYRIHNAMHEQTMQSRCMQRFDDTVPINQVFY